MSKLHCQTNVTVKNNWPWQPEVGDFVNSQCQNYSVNEPKRQNPNLTLTVVGSSLCFSNSHVMLGRAMTMRTQLSSRSRSRSTCLTTFLSFCSCFSVSRTCFLTVPLFVLISMQFTCSHISKQLLLLNPFTAMMSIKTINKSAKFETLKPSCLFFFFFSPLHVTGFSSKRIALKADVL